jgi:hypothetical protein
VQHDLMAVQEVERSLLSKLMLTQWIKRRRRRNGQSIMHVKRAERRAQVHQSMEPVHFF